MAFNNPEFEMYKNVRRIIFIYIIVLIGFALILGILHLFLGDMHFEGIKMFNLDKERNLPTWFSGVLLFLFGCASLYAFFCEKRINLEKGIPIFRLPILWVGIAIAGFLMSLDEITILHENILWQEIRLLSDKAHPALIYVTQWQILFAPIIVFLLVYFILFFSNRYKSCKPARKAVFLGIGFLLVSLILESLRNTFKQYGMNWYSTSVLIEEICEMFFAISLLSSVVLYSLSIALSLSKERVLILQHSTKFLTKKAFIKLLLVILSFIIIGMVAFNFADKLARKGTPIPSLHKRAIKSE